MAEQPILFNTPMGNWIPKSERLPKPEDADPQQCVVAWHEYNGAMIIGWRQVEENRYVSHWQPCPLPPEGTRAHERMMMERRKGHGGKTGPAHGARRMDDGG